MKRVLLFLLACLVIFGLVGCSAEHESVQDVMAKVEKALEERDVETLKGLMHRDAKVFTQEFYSGEAYTNLDDYYLTEALDSLMDWIDRRGLETVCDFQIKIAENGSPLDEMKEIIADKKLDIDTSKIIPCDIEIYVNGECVEDGYVMLYQEDSEIKILLLVPWW